MHATDPTPQTPPRPTAHLLLADQTRPLRPRTPMHDTTTTGDLAEAPISPSTPPHHHSHRASQHTHSAEGQRRIVNRLSRIEGHVRGIKTMVQEDRPCPDVLIQIAAVRGALDRVARAILDEHLSACVVRAAQDGNIEAELDELKAALDRFL